MGSIDYKKLYDLQDRVLDIVFKIENIFYLTGGTCISRFYKEKRYSDDLDLFTNINNGFNLAVKEIKNALNQKFKIKEEVNSRDFIRLKVNGILQVNFVNDRVMRYKKPVHLDNGYLIDNIENILANKITAIIGRDNPKDIFDVYLLDKFYSTDWSNILDIAHQKADFNDDDLIIRLKTFPLSLLKNINLIDKKFLDNFKIEHNLIIEKIEQARI